MAKPRTSEELEKYFNTFKTKKQKQKEHQRQKRKRERTEEYKAINKALQQEKKDAADKLINELKQIAPEPKETPIRPFYQTNVGDFDELTLYQSWQEIEADTSGKLNPNYRELIERTKAIVSP